MIYKTILECFEKHLAVAVLSSCVVSFAFAEDCLYPVMQRTVCTGPKGVDRLGYGSFLDFEFGARLKELLPPLKTDSLSSNKYYGVVKELKPPYYGCKEIELRYDFERHMLFNATMHWTTDTISRPVSYCKEAAEMASSAHSRLNLPLVDKIVVKEADYSALKVGDVAVRYHMEDKSFTVKVEVRKENGGCVGFFVSATSHSVTNVPKIVLKNFDDKIEVDI